MTKFGNGICILAYVPGKIPEYCHVRVNLHSSQKSVSDSLNFKSQLTN